MLWGEDGEEPEHPLVGCGGMWKGPTTRWVSSTLSMNQGNSFGQAGPLVLVTLRVTLPHMAKPGPSKGQGGRPRKPASQQAKTSEGYRQVTVGPKSKGHRVYAHRAAAGLANTKGSKSGKTGGVVHHEDGNRTNNSRSNLRVTTKKGNAQRRRS